MLRQVWIDSWQMQCCGDPFRVGQRVEFSTTPVLDREFLDVFLGEQRTAALTDYEDHHDLEDGPMSLLTGTVTSIEAISCRYEPQGRAMHPVADTANVVRCDEATGWETERDDVHVVGYVVTLQPE